MARQIWPAMYGSGPPATTNESLYWKILNLMPRKKRSFNYLFCVAARGSMVPRSVAVRPATTTIRSDAAAASDFVVPGFNAFYFYAFTLLGRRRRPRKKFCLLNCELPPSLSAFSNEMLARKLGIFLCKPF